jgi:cyclophilin family peptidyl-prolyl cis-trans isomerase
MGMLPMLFCARAGSTRHTAIAAFVVVISMHRIEACAHQYVRLDYNLTLNNRSRDTVFIEVFDDKPLTQANFMEYVNQDRYDGMFMHRLAKNFVIQGGGFYPEFVEEPPPVNVSLDPTAIVDRDGNPSTPNPTVTNEYSVPPIRSNLIGTIAMAKIGGQPNSATNQWFVNLANNTFLDTSNGGFTVFARVMGDGMNLFNAFNSLSIGNLNPDVNDDGSRDGGPFYNYTANPPGTDGVPYLAGSQGDILVIVEDAERIDYLGNGLTTNVPAGGLTFSAYDAFIDTGTIFTGSGTLTIGAGRTLGIREGFALNRPLVNFGTLAPGLQLGSAQVQSFRQDSGASLEIQLRGTTADTQHDRLVVTDGALLGGDLDVSLISGFVPAVNNTFTILTANLIVDTFDSIHLPQLNAGLVWNVTQTATAFTLTVATGDYNRDGVVDAGDYVMWRKMRNPSLAVTAYSSADGNGDGFVNDLDYDVWRRNLGNTRGGELGDGPSTNVPEPAAAALLLIGGGFFGCLRRRAAAAPNGTA